MTQPPQEPTPAPPQEPPPTQPPAAAASSPYPGFQPPPAAPTQPPTPTAPPPYPGSQQPLFRAPAPGGAYPAEPWQTAATPPGGAAPRGWAPAPGHRAAGRADRGPESGAWIAGLVLIAIGALLLLGRWVPDAGEYIVLAIGLVLLVVFLVTREYGALIPGAIVTGVGAGIPLTTAYPGELGGALFLMALGGGFLLIWILGLLFRVPENHWWPLIPGLILGSIGAAMTAGERGQGIADAITTGWPIVLVVAGLLLLVQAVRRRPG